MRIPRGFTTVFPYIFAEEAAAYLDFLRDGLGGEIIDVHSAPDGRVANAQIRFDDMTLMVSEATATMPPTYGTYYRYVADADAAMARAVAAGGVEMMKVANMPYGDRQGGMRDPRGNIWWLSQHLENADYYGGPSEPVT